MAQVPFADLTGDGVVWHHDTIPAITPPDVPVARTSLAAPIQAVTPSQEQGHTVHSEAQAQSTLHHKLPKAAAQVTMPCAVRPYMARVWLK